MAVVFSQDYYDSLKIIFQLLDTVSLTKKSRLKKQSKQKLVMSKDLQISTNRFQIKLNMFIS